MPQRAADADIHIAATALEHRRHAERNIVCCAVRSSAGHHVCEVLEHTQAVSGRRRDVEGEAPPDWPGLHVCCIICARNACDRLRCRVWPHAAMMTGCGVANSGCRRLCHKRPCDCPPRRLPCGIKLWQSASDPATRRHMTESAEQQSVQLLIKVSRQTPAK